MTNKKAIAALFVFLVGIIYYLGVNFYSLEGRQSIPISATKSLKQLVPYLNVAEGGQDEQAVHLISKLFGSEGKQVLVSLWQQSEVEGVRYERIRSSIPLRLTLASELILIDKENVEEYKKFIYNYLYDVNVTTRSIATFALGNVDEIKSVEELQRILSHEKEVLQLANAIAAVEKLYNQSSNSQVKLKAKKVIEESRFGLKKGSLENTIHN